MFDKKEEAKTGIELGMDLITNNDVEQLQTVPYIVYEMNETRHERREKRIHYWLILPLIVALLLSNLAWLYVFQSYDYVNEDVTIDNNDGGNANYIGNDGEINNGKDKSKEIKQN